jgi:lysozyme
MKLSIDGLAIAHYFESCKLEAYPDPGSKDGTPWTIGWGHTGTEVVKGLKWTQARADAQLEKDMAVREAAVSRLVTAPITQKQFDALVLFQYNTGSLSTSTLLKKLNTGDMEGAKAEFARWNKNDGQVMKGLTRRRAAEAALFAGFSGRESIALSMSVR